MSVVNKKDLLENAHSDKEKRARKAALKVMDAALKAANPRTAVRKHVEREDSILRIDGLSFDLNGFQEVLVVGGGKAAGVMAEAIEEVLVDRITEGFVNILRRTKSSFKTQKVFLNEASHPIPDNDGVVGARKMFHLVSKADEKSLVICLISGGGSALMCLPSADVSLEDKAKLTDALLKCGATINEINAVRKHISELKGGQIAKAAYPATLVSLILSDVVGDPIHMVASGPTAPDPTTFKDAISILKKYNLWRGRVPRGVKERLEAGLRGEIPETPKPGDQVFEKTYNVLVGNNRVAALAACQEARTLGFNALLLSSVLEGEARHIGTVYSGIAREILVSNNPIPRPAVIVAGGETTVTVKGKGKGGRNQELALSASLGIDGLDGVAIASIATDGVDGPTDAAGAVVDGKTMYRAQNKKLDPKEFLTNNDSYSFFSKLDDLIFTSPTGTNVNDVTVIVVV